MTTVMTVPRTRRFRVSEYYRMAEAGILTENDRVELIDGEIVEMVPIGHNHAGGVNRFNRLFSLCFADAAIVSVQNPVRLGEYSEPEPDLALLRPRADFYASAHPTPADVLLLVEIADTSLDFDRGVKAPLYARAGIPEVWLVDLGGETVAVYREPSPEGYRATRVLRAGERVATLAFPERELAVAALLGVAEPA